MDILLETKILQSGFQKKKTLENKYEIKIILPSMLYYEPLNYFKIILNIQRNIRKLIDGDTSNLNYLKYVNFLSKSNFISNYPDSKSYFNLPQQISTPSMSKSTTFQIPSNTSRPPSNTSRPPSTPTIIIADPPFPPKRTQTKYIDQHYTFLVNQYVEGDVIRIPVNQRIIIPNKTNEGLRIEVASPDLFQIFSLISPIITSHLITMDIMYLDTLKLGETTLTIFNKGDEDYRPFKQIFNIEVYDPSIKDDNPPPPRVKTIKTPPPPPNMQTAIALAMPVTMLTPFIIQLLTRVFFCEVSTYKSEVYSEYIKKTWARLGKSGSIDKETFLSNLTVEDLYDAFTVVKRAVMETQYYHGGERNLWLLNHDIIEPINGALHWLNFMRKLANTPTKSTLMEMNKKLYIEYHDSYIPFPINFIDGKEVKEKEINFEITQNDMEYGEENYRKKNQHGEEHNPIVVKKDDNEHVSTMKQVEQEKLEEKVRFEQSLIRNYQAFQRGDKFKHIHNGKTGKVANLRDDEHEQTQRKSVPSTYYYSVDYDDGSSETYLNQDYMIKI
jgi:hypothetical protein